MENLTRFGVHLRQDLVRIQAGCVAHGLQFKHTALKRLRVPFTHRNGLTITHIFPRSILEFRPDLPAKAKSLANHSSRSLWASLKNVCDADHTGSRREIHILAANFPPDQPTTQRVPEAVTLM